MSTSADKSAPPKDSATAPNSDRSPSASFLTPKTHVLRASGFPDEPSEDVLIHGSRPR